jgi:hypothetical protein
VQVADVKIFMASFHIFSYVAFLENIMENQIKEIILSSPFEGKRERIMLNADKFVLTPEEFIEFCYVDPCFDEEISILDEEIKKSSNYYHRDDLHGDISYVRSRKIAKDKFEESLNSTSINPIYIRGFAGTGKTTYINTLLYKKHRYNLERELFELNKSEERVLLFSFYWRNKNFVFTLYKFISILMTKLSDYLEMKKNESEDEYRQRMNLILNNYYKFFFYSNVKIHTNIFKIIEGYIKDKFPYSAKDLEDDDINTFCTKMYNEIIAYCSDNNDKIKADETIKNLLELIVVVLTCNHPTEKIESEDFGNILFFDNIENFIGTHQVYNEDINTISEIFHKFIDSMAGLFNKLGSRGLQFSRHFKFILAIRDTTEKMIHDVHLHGQDGDSLVQLNISTWFSLDEIAKKKISYFKKKGIEASLPITDAILTMFNDHTSRKSGLRDILSMMYNHNKRRIVSYLSEIWDQHPDCSKDYCNLWKIALDYEKQNNPLAAAYKNAARQMILRLLLDLIEKCNYFEKIRALDGLGLARKLIINLHRHDPLNDMEDDLENLGYIGFYTLLKPLLDNPYDDDSTKVDYRETIDEIAEILCTMNSPNKKKTNWCQLVEIKFNQSSFDERELSNKLLECYKNKCDQSKNYAIKITEAGRYFLEGIVPIFEYFSCRYNKNSSPLFSSYNLKLIKKESKNASNHATEHIKSMKKTIFKRIDNVVMGDINFFKINKSVNFGAMYSSNNGALRMYCYEPPSRKYSNRNEQCNPVRVLHSNISYIDNYRAFILTIKKQPHYSDYLEEYSDEIIVGLSHTILNIIEDYVDKLQLLINNELGKHDVTIEEYPYVGKMNVESEKRKCEVYRKKLIDAKQSPENYEIRITTVD